MIKNEHQFLISMLKDFLHGEKTTVPDGLDFAEVYRVCHAHQVEAICYHQLKGNNSVPADLISKLKTYYFSAPYNYSRRKAFLVAMEKRFEEENIPFFIFKGIEIAKLYPIPALRSMGDFGAS